MVKVVCINIQHFKISIFTQHWSQESRTLFMLKFKLIIQSHNEPQQHTTTTVLRLFVWDYQVEPVPEETLTHQPSWSSSNLYQLLQSTTIHSNLPVQITCLAFCTTSLHVLFGLPLCLEPSTSYSIHFFTNQCLLFATHTHTIATCFAVVAVLYHLFLVLLSSPYLELYLLP